jgi:hypothetical protein
VNALVVPGQNVLLVTAAGEPYCITVTVLITVPARSPSNFGAARIWSEDQTPEGEGFCSNATGDPEVSEKNGVIEITVPEPPQASGKTGYTVYRYGWVGKTYGFVGREATREARKRETLTSR